MIFRNIEVQGGRRAKFSYNDWSATGSRVVNDVRGQRSRSNAQSRQAAQTRGEVNTPALVFFSMELYFMSTFCSSFNDS